MIMIEELKKMIYEKIKKEEEDIETNTNDVIDDLKLQVLNLKENNVLLQRRAERAEENLKIALDEIAQNQIRINALLKQLQDKKGGRQYIV